MKKLVILVLFSLIGLTTMAQSLPINIGIHGGWNDAKIKAKEYKVDSHGGYMIGAFARINLGEPAWGPAPERRVQRYPAAACRSTPQAAGSFRDVYKRQI